MISLNSRQKKGHCLQPKQWKERISCASGYLNLHKELAHPFVYKAKKEKIVNGTNLQTIDERQ